MRQVEWLQETKKMRFKEAFWDWREGCLTALVQSNKIFNALKKIKNVLSNF